MFNHNRGLWGYTGRASDGDLLTIQSTGMGGPSAAIVIAELSELGARRMVRVGTCGALRAALTLGEIIIVTEALAADGASRALGAGDRVAPSQGLLAVLSRAAAGRARMGVVASTDLFYAAVEEGFRQAGALAVEMETATLFAFAAREATVEAASALIVSDLLAGERVRIDPEPLREAEHRLGQIALAALRCETPPEDDQVSSTKRAVAAE